MSREHGHRDSLTSLRRSSLVSTVFESTSTKIFPLEPDLDFDSSRRSSFEHYRGYSHSYLEEPLMGRSGPSRNLEGKTRLHPKR